MPEVSRNLTVDTAVPYLIEQDLLRSADIVTGDLEVVDVGRRNQNLTVHRRGNSGYLLKQAGAGEPASEVTIRSEAMFYRHCGEDPVLEEVRKVIPSLHRWDEENCLLICELIDGIPLWAHWADEVPNVPCASSAQLGLAIGTVHRAFREPSPSSSLIARASADPPWVLHAHRPTPEMFTYLSPANSEVLRLIQRERSMVLALDRLRREWTTSTLIHNDLKGDNVLITTSTEADVRVHIVDWELFQVGDPAWDVGSVLRDFLNYWLLSVPLSGDQTPKEMLQGAQIPLANLHPAIRAFWDSYQIAAEIEASIRGPFLLRAIEYAAARMAQGAYELSLSAHQPPNYAYAVLQLSVNILSDPRGASLHLFGLPLPWSRA